MLYERFIEFALANYAFTAEEAMGAGHPDFEGTITAGDLREALTEWRRRAKNGSNARPSKVLTPRPVGKPRVIPEGIKCQNPHICGGAARSLGPDGLFVCSNCYRRWKKTGSLEPAATGRPRLYDGKLCSRCGRKAAAKKGMCNSCYSAGKYASNRKPE